jgi:hypothetical protein
MKSSSALFRTISTIVLIGLLPVVSLSGLSNSAMAQQSKIPREALQVVDASTGKLIPELLLIPRYSSFKGTSTLLGEGPGRGSDRDYLAKPFVYRSGTPFILKLPKSTGFGLPGLLFMGKGRSIQGVLLIAPGYRPLWFTSLWSVGSKRRLQLTPISGNEWSMLLEKTLSRLVKDVPRIEGNCSFWDIPAPCSLEIHYNKKERELVRSFLHKTG